MINDHFGAPWEEKGEGILGKERENCFWEVVGWENDQMMISVAGDIMSRKRGGEPMGSLQKLEGSR